MYILFLYSGKRFSIVNGCLVKGMEGKVKMDFWNWGYDLCSGFVLYLFIYVVFMFLFLDFFLGCNDLIFFVNLG